MIKETITLDDFIASLNEILETDREAISALFHRQVECNAKLADHPTVQVWSETANSQASVRLVGLLNGIFGVFGEGKKAHWGALAAEYDEGDLLTILRFVRIKNK